MNSWCLMKWYWRHSSAFIFSVTARSHLSSTTVWKLHSGTKGTNQLHVWKSKLLVDSILSSFKAEQTSAWFWWQIMLTVSPEMQLTDANQLCKAMFMSHCIGQSPLGILNQVRKQLNNLLIAIWYKIFQYTWFKDIYLPAWKCLQNYW